MHLWTKKEKTLKGKEIGYTFILEKLQIQLRLPLSTVRSFSGGNFTEFSCCGLCNSPVLMVISTFVGYFCLLFNVFLLQHGASVWCALIILFTILESERFANGPQIAFKAILLGGSGILHI